MRKKQNYAWSTLNLGTCYYPEHWDRELWEDDMKRMLDAGIGTVRIAEFSWSKVEPEEGTFTYEFFDEFLEVAHRFGMKVIFGTPSATPPAWLTEKYPEVLNASIDGVLYRHGMRRHYNYNSPKYRELTARIVEKLGAHYAKHPAVIGWQIDNELNCETSDFYSESDSAAFRIFLKERYKTLDALNEAWGTVFWNQTYTGWEEIHVPRPTIHNSTNPHEMLDYHRFVSESAISFCRMQSDILRKYLKPGDFITTNGMFDKLDNHRMTDEALDVYTYDSYPNFAYCLDADPLAPGNLNDRRWSRNLTEVRSICPHFGIMEQQSGANGWNTRMEAPAPKPGQMMLWAMQSIAHGADFISFFRWRTCTFGTEIYWHGILDYDNRDNRKLAEVRKIHKRIRAIAPMAGAGFKAAFGLVRDYDNIWDSDVDVWHHRLEKMSTDEIFRASQLTHTPMDEVFLLEDTDVEELCGYPLLIYPHPLILTQKRADLLKKYVEMGGTLLIGARAGQKDISGKCVMQPMPGLLRPLTGTTVREFTFISPADAPQSMTWNGSKGSADAPHNMTWNGSMGSADAPHSIPWNGSSIPTGIFSDILDADAPDANVLAVYDNDYYRGSAALIERKCKEGRVLHFGGTFTYENVCQFLEYSGVLSPWKDLVSLPEACELVVREKDGIQYLFILNYSWETQKICLNKAFTDMDTGLTAEGEIEFPAFGTKVYSRLADSQ